MDRKILDKIFKKLDVKEADMISIGETWPTETIGGNKARSKFKYYDVTMKNGDKFFLKLNHLSDDLRSIDDIGYELMV